jgi:hypothetical protein
LVPLSSIFRVQYGNQFNANALERDRDGVNFVTRSARRLGIGGRVSRIEDIQPFEAGCITAGMGGSYLLSAFVQPREFYTAQNIKVLRPIEPMSFNEKVFYCQCISANRWLYSSHGREANRSFDTILVPDRSQIPSWVQAADAPRFDATEFASLWDGGDVAVDDEGLVPLRALFDLYSGEAVPKALRCSEDKGDGFAPLVRPSSTQAASYVDWVDTKKLPAEWVYPPGTLHVSTNGQGSHTYAYVSVRSFVPNIDVTVALPKRPMSIAEKLFYAAAISKNRPLFSYGRKPKGGRLGNVRVPSRPPDFARDRKAGEGLLSW